MLRRAVPAPRRAAIAPLAAFLIIALFGMVAFVLDLGWVVIARTQLQTAADAAALAGADPLMDGYVQYQLAGSGGQLTVLNNALSAARAKAKAFAAANGAGGVSGLTLNDADIEFGFTDGTYNYTPYTSGGPFPNTIKVTLRRDAGANGPLGLFFGPALGAGSTNLKATAAAVVVGGTVNSLGSGGRNVGVLPAAYDVNAWNNFCQTGRWPDGTSSVDAGGVPQLQVYPCVQNGGNFGTLSLDDSHTGATSIDGWIQSGMAGSDVQALVGAGEIPLSGHNASNWDWLGDVGFASGHAATVNNYAGKTFLLPLFTPRSAASPGPYWAGSWQESGYCYNVVRLVGVRVVTPPNPSGQVYLQPAAVVDPGAVFSSVGPVDTTQGGSSLLTTFSYPRLSQ
jgi:hypothetical protein